MSAMHRQLTQSITDRIQRILMDFGLPASTLTDQHFTRDLGMDSLDVTDLLIQVETDFGIRIDDRNWQMIRTIDALAEYIAIEDGMAVANVMPANRLPQPASLASYPLFN